MDDELSALEAELKRLQPAAVPEALTRRVGREMERSAGPARRIRLAPVKLLWMAALPAAAAVTFLLLQTRRIEPVDVDAMKAPAAAPQVAPMMLKPVVAENLLVRAQDEGWVTLDDGTTARRARLNYLDTITWEDPRTRASLTWTVPREEVRIVPVAF